jgi:hypothetical protein
MFYYFVGMKTLKQYGLAICLLMLAGCGAKKDPLINAWIYDDNLSDEQQQENARLYHSHEDYLLTAANFIDLQPDSTYTAYLFYYDFGKWYFKDQELILVSHNKKIREWSVKKVDGKRLVCMDKAKNLVYRFDGYGNSFKTPGENPFSRENNLWRMKATHKESDSEIAGRLKNHFKFWEKYFAWGLHNGVRYLDVRNVPGVLKLYGNGFQLYYYSEELPEWRNAFYDSADSWKAYEKIYYTMAAKRIQWPETKDRFKIFISAFQQMQGWMDTKEQEHIKQGTRNEE